MVMKGKVCGATHFVSWIWNSTLDKYAAAQVTAHASHSSTRNRFLNGASLGNPLRIFQILRDPSTARINKTRQKNVEAGSSTGPAGTTRNHGLGLMAMMDGWDSRNSCHKWAWEVVVVFGSAPSQISMCNTTFKS